MAAALPLFTWPIDTWRLITDLLADTDLVDTCIVLCRLTPVAPRLFIVLLPLRNEYYHLFDITWQHERSEEEDGDIARTMRELDTYLDGSSDSETLSSSAW